jgi:hypothetical protein
MSTHDATPLRRRDDFLRCDHRYAISRISSVPDSSRQPDLLALGLVGLSNGVHVVPNPPSGERRSHFAFAARGSMVSGRHTQ